MIVLIANCFSGIIGVLVLAHVIHRFRREIVRCVVQQISIREPRLHAFSTATLQTLLMRIANVGSASTVSVHLQISVDVIQGMVDPAVKVYHPLVLASCINFLH